MGNEHQDNQEKSMCQQFVCWPFVIYIIIAIIALISILFSARISSNQKAWSFFGTLIFVLIWAAIIYFFCQSGNHAIAWFLLLLPLAIAIFWAISVFLAAATTSPECIVGGDSKEKKEEEW